MKKLFSSLSIKIVAASSVVLFTLASLVIGCVAWFTNINQKHNEQDDFPVVNVTSNGLSISLHEWYGSASSTVWGFNPTPVATIDFSTNSSNSFSFDMDEYSLEDQDHPVLFLLEVEGVREFVRAVTECSFVAETPSEIKASYATYASLSTSGLSSGDYVLVNEDENYNSSTKPTTLRKYNGSSFTSVTYATKTALDAALEADSSHSTFVDGACFGVVSDNEHNNSTTVYKYSGTSNKLEMIYFKLESENNPLSSAVKFNTLSFANDPKTNGTQSYDFGDGTKTYMPINKSELSEDKSFVTINSNGDASFSKEVAIYDDDIESIKYIGIVMNYNPAALEYICSYYLGNPLLEEDLGFSCDWGLYV